MAKTKAELQDELIGLRNGFNRIVKVYDEKSKKINDLEKEVQECENELIELEEKSKQLERLQAAHVKLGDKWREEIKRSTEMAKQRDLRDASIAELREVKRKLNQELEHFKERSNYHYLLHQQTADKLGTIEARLEVSLFREKENQRTIERLETLYEYSLIDINRCKDENRDLTMKLIESNEKLETLEGKK